MAKQEQIIRKNLEKNKVTKKFRPSISSIQNKDLRYTYNSNDDNDNDDACYTINEGIFIEKQMRDIRNMYV